MKLAKGFRGFAVIDVETNGLSPEHDRILEIAVVSLATDMSIESTWTTLVNPGTSRMGRTDIHNIHIEDLEFAPTFCDLVGDLIKNLQGRILVAHNIDFDSGFLCAEFDRTDISVNLSQVPGLDTLDIARQRWPGKRASLDVCCQRAGISRPVTHSAFADAMATAYLLRYLFEFLDRSTIPALERAMQKATNVVWPSMPDNTVNLVPRRQ